MMVFEGVIELCEQLGIRHPEEMSLIKARPCTGQARGKKNGYDEREVSPAGTPAVEVTSSDYPDGLFGDLLARTTEERANLNALWLDSTKSLAEQVG